LTILHKYSDGLLDNFKKQYYVPQNLQKMALLCALHSADTNIKLSEKSPIAELTPLRRDAQKPHSINKNPFSDHFLRRIILAL
jgi:hypothetical protein